MIGGLDIADPELLALDAELAAIEKRECENHFNTFVRCAWDVLEPDTELVWNWHLDYICDELQTQAERMAAGKPKEYDLVINVPPRSLKSTICSKMFPAWVWLRFPSQRFLTASYSAELSLEHAVATRQLILSPWYQGHWGDRFVLQYDQNVKSYYQNDHRGYRMATSVGGSTTGRGGDWLLCDDGLGAQEAESQLYRQRCINWWSRSMHKRLNNQAIGMRIVIMQRLHEDDLTGWIISQVEKKKARYKLIVLPAEDCEWVSPPELRRMYFGGLLFPGRLNKEVLAEDRSTLGEYGYSGQMMQRPSPEEGGIFKRHLWKFWRPQGSNLPDYAFKSGGEVKICECIDLPDRFDDCLDSWDMAFKDTKHAKSKNIDYVAGGKLSSSGSRVFLLAEVRGRLSYPETSKAVLGLNARMPRSSGILIEDKANGPAVISDLDRTTRAIIPVEPRGGKESRAMPLSRAQHAGNLYLPHPSLAPWVEDFIAEFAAFPNGSHDDRVDYFSQAYDRIASLPRVIRAYSGRMHKFRVNFRNLRPESALYCSQWVMKDLTSALILGLWNPEKKKLYIFAELLTSNSMAEMVKFGVESLIARISGGYLKDCKPFTWLGNALMFGKEKAAYTTKYKAGIYEAYSRTGVELQDNSLYDDAGAITITTRMFLQQMIEVGGECSELSRQLMAWVIDGNMQSAGFPCARALCNLCSVLWESGKVSQKTLQMPPFSREKDQYREALARADEAGTIDSFDRNSELWYRNNELPPTQNSWMR